MRFNIKSVFFLCFTISVSIFAGDFSSWRKGDIAYVSWEFVKNTKKELLERAAAVEDITGEKVGISFTHNANMDRKQQSLHERFLKYRMTEKQIHEYLAPYLAELEKNRAILATAEEKAEKIWEEKNKNGELEEDVTSEAKLYGETIKSKRLGVVLDHSYSMAQVLPKLREEIKTKFKNSYFVEIYGSRFNLWNTDPAANTWYYISPEEGENPFLKKWHCQSYPLQNAHYFISGFRQSNLQAFTALVTMRKVDTIYWFTDLRDNSNDRGHEYLARLLKKHKVKLYVHTTGNQPKTDLRKIIKATDGDIIRKRVN